MSQLPQDYPKPPTYVVPDDAPAHAMANAYGTRALEMMLQSQFLDVGRFVGDPDESMTRLSMRVGVLSLGGAAAPPHEGATSPQTLEHIAAVVSAMHATQGWPPVVVEGTALVLG